MILKRIENPSHIQAATFFFRLIHIIRPIFHGYLYFKNNLIDDSPPPLDCNSADNCYSM